MSPFLWHGLLMSIAWLVLLPAGALLARFFKVRRSQPYPFHLDDPFWWNGHRALQTLGTGLAALAAWIAWTALGGAIDWQVSHVQFGVVALSLLLVQFTSPAFRGSKGGPTDRYADPYDPETWRGDHFDMTVRRRVFEFLHKKLGYAGMAVAVCAIWTGIELVGLGDWWKLPVVGAVLVFAALFGWWTTGRRRVPTWQAIWGPYDRGP